MRSLCGLCVSIEMESCSLVLVGVISWYKEKAVQAALNCNVGTWFQAGGTLPDEATKDRWMGTWMPEPVRATEFVGVQVASRSRNPGCCRMIQVECFNSDFDGDGNDCSTPPDYPVPRRGL